MLITIKEEVTREIEIGEFPLYRKGVAHNVKVVSMDEVISVSIGLGWSIDLRKYKGSANTWLTGYEESNEQEFLDAYYKVHNMISDLVEPSEKEYPLNLQKAI